MRQTETSPLLFSFDRSTLQNPSLNYASSRPISPLSAPPSRLSKWKRWTGGAGIVPAYEWPYRRKRNSYIISLQAPGRGKEEIPADALVLPLFLITLSCAIADAGSLVAFQTFATSMTGNTVLLAISAFGLSHKPPIYAASSLLSFIGAGLLFGQIGGVVGHRRRSWLLASLMFQILLLGCAAWVVSPLGRSELQLGGRLDWLYLLLIGLQGGPQVTLATNSGVRELPTGMMTTPYAAFISDPSLFSVPSPLDPKSVISRNRRFIYILLFWIGSFIGGAMMKWSSLWVLTAVVAGVKVLAAGLIWVSEGEVKDATAERDQIDEEVTDTDFRRESGINRGFHTRRERTSSFLGSFSMQKPRDEATVAM